MPVKKCPFCSRPVREETIDCPHCGREVDAIETPAPPVAAVGGSKQAHTTDQRHGVAGGCALTPMVAAILLGLAWITYSDHGVRLYLWPFLGVLGLTSWIWVPAACISSRPVLQADCPHCGTYVQCPSTVAGFDCPSCARRVHVRDNTFSRE